MRIALDAMGGDHGIAPNVVGAVKAVAAQPDLTVILVGDQAQLDAALATAGAYPADRIEIVHCTEVVGMDEKPVDALRKKPDNSISKGWQLVATKKVDGFVSAGNTGAVVGAGLFTRRFLKGIRKPGIATLMPTAKGRCVVLDVGANVFAKPAHLIHYGVMGAAFAKHIMNVEKPTIGLMNVGEEEGKGHDLVQQAYTMFKSGPLADRFVGNIEGRDVHKGNVDVIVTDGFVGNVLLKHAEGAFEFVMGSVFQTLGAGLTAEKDLAFQLLKKMSTKFHYSNYGGAPLLGVDGICIICHGSSDDKAITSALGVAAQNARVKLNDRIVEELAALPDLGADE